MVTIAVYDETADALDEYADRNGVSVADVVEVLCQYLEDLEV